jgi:hypothetical protein
MTRPIAASCPDGARRPTADDRRRAAEFVRLFIQAAITLAPLVGCFQ